MCLEMYIDFSISVDKINRCTSVINSHLLESKIVGGRKVYFKKYKTPVISIRKNFDHHCTGAFITHSFAASLAQCLYEIREAILRAQAGPEFREGNNVVYDIAYGETSRYQSSICFIEGVHIHDQYVHFGREGISPYDIGVLKVTAAVDFAIKPLQVMTGPPECLTDSIVAGWGSYTTGPSSTSYIPDDLYRTSVYLKDITACFGPSYQPALDASHFEHLMCIVPAEDSYLTNGDIGNPVYRKPTLVGLASKIFYDSPGSPSIAVKVYSHSVYINRAKTELGGEHPFE